MEVGSRNAECGIEKKLEVGIEKKWEVFEVGRKKIEGEKVGR
jgi:hypothetical protein